MVPRIGFAQNLPPLAIGKLGGLGAVRRAQFLRFYNPLTWLYVPRQIFI
jgi:hypothetical protein